VRRATLDDAFLKLTGQAIASEEDDEAEKKTADRRRSGRDKVEVTR
jgi:hypothetical protein